MDMINVTPRTAWTLLESESNAVLVDVRTEPEWLFVGVPDPELLGKNLVRASWQVYPSMDRNHAFAAQLAEAGIEKDQTIFLICRSGVRSKAAALFLRESGYLKAFNVEGGFEGDLDDRKHRGIGGWKAANLPWKQG